MIESGVNCTLCSLGCRCGGFANSGNAMIKKTVGAFCVAALLGSGAAVAQDKWYPSPFGKDDQAGRSNLMTPDQVKKAMG